jgi:hypothetical protein
VHRPKTMPISTISTQYENSSSEFLFSCRRWLTEQAKAALSPAQKLQHSAMMQAYYTSWIQYYELFKISEAVIHLNVYTNESLPTQGQERKSTKTEIYNDESYPRLKAVHQYIMNLSLTLNPWVASRLIVTHARASHDHYRKF